MSGAPWFVAATLYRIYKDNRRAGSFAFSVNDGGSPIWYALWGLVRHLSSQRRRLSLVEEQREAREVKEAPHNDDGRLFQAYRSSGIASRQVSESEKLKDPSTASALVSQNPTMATSKLGLSASQAAHTNPDVARSVNSAAYSRDLSVHLEPDDDRAGNSSSVYLSSNTALRQQDPGFWTDQRHDRGCEEAYNRLSWLRAPANDMPPRINSLNDLQTLMASKG